MSGFYLSFYTSPPYQDRCLDAASSMPLKYWSGCLFLFFSSPSSPWAERRRKGLERSLLIFISCHVQMQTALIFTILMVLVEDGTHLVPSFPPPHSPEKMHGDSSHQRPKPRRRRQGKEGGGGGGGREEKGDRRTCYNTKKVRFFWEGKCPRLKMSTEPPPPPPPRLVPKKRERRSRRFPCRHVLGMLSTESCHLPWKIFGIPTNSGELSNAP